MALYANRRRVTLKVAHLVLWAFVGPRPDGQEACHWNGVRHDNRLANLRWDTIAANRADSRRHGTLPVGERSHFAKLTNAGIAEVRRLYSEGETYSEIARQLGIHRSTVTKAVKRITWAHVP